MNLFCVHCHFHQPPRENPYLGLLPIEASASPFKNWNERIFRESYLPNMYAHYTRDGKILKIVNNYKGISFNFTQSLLSWLLREKPWFVERLKKARENAIATSFNHTILPLDPEEDREVQIVWGIRVFEKIFGRKPKGFWLPELAVDKKTLSLLIKHGIGYTILAPHQVKTKGSFLRYAPPEGHIDIFVYDGELSHGVAFGDLINKAEEIIRRTKDRKGLTLIAIDGETFGHHKKFGEMGLAYLIENHPNITTLERVYESMHPEGETEINEFTSWSCAHGVERWRSDCGCTTGGAIGWHQKWRKPLREALERVREQVKERLFDTLEQYTYDPKEALFDFVEVIMGQSKEEYFKKHLKKAISQEERIKVLKLLYAYKYISYAFSSDGWFFGDISGIEAVKNLLFAKRAIDLLGDEKVEKRFLDILSLAPSNVQSYGNGLGVWQKLVLPQRISKESLITSIVLLELSNHIPEEGVLGKFYYKVEGFEPWRVFLRDLETEEEFEGIDDLKSFEGSKIPQPLLDMLINQWAMEYFEREIEFVESYERLFENLLTYAHGESFESDSLLRLRVSTYLRIKLYILLKKLASLESIREVFNQALSFGTEIWDERLKFWFEEYISKRIISGISEEEGREIALFVKEYNRHVGKFELMVNLWELQNWAWENRDNLSEETLRLLDFRVFQK